MLRVTIPRTSHMVRATPRKVKASDIKHAIKHAQNICFNFENTPECRSAWEVVDELTEALDTQISRREGSSGPSPADSSRRPLYSAVYHEGHIRTHKLS